jgi:hypothetical protein
MRDYRVLELRPDGHVRSRFDFSARDDEAAKEQALQASSSQDVELWRHDRKISEWRATAELAQDQAVIQRRLNAMYPTKTALGRHIIGRLKF